MTNIINHSELLKRAAAYVAETINEQPTKDLQSILDEAGMRFNLSPIDSEGLKRLFTKEACNKSNA